jgi:hypothetical protein
MDSPQKMDVVEWEDSPLPAVPKIGARQRVLPPTLIGIVGTLVMHAMLIQSVSFASRGPKPKPPETRESANALSKSTGDNLVLISLPTITSANQVANAISSLPDLSKMKIKSAISADPPDFLNLETLALNENQASGEFASSTDGGEIARLFGIYTGQIQARIDRVWRRPRTPVSDGTKSAEAGESFQCEAQVVQDFRGNVQEVMLPRCNGSAAWQHSLIAAIQHASPLPTPPSSRVFSNSITLRFIGLSYESGFSEDGYEIAAGKLATE